MEHDHDADVSMDVDRFISEVQLRPAIWDFHSEFNRSDKLKAWEEICELFIKDYKTNNRKDKGAICNKLQRKWKSLRDCFNREIGKQKKNRAPGRKKYIYFNKLAFLKRLRNDIPVSEDETTENDFGLEQQEERNGDEIFKSSTRLKVTNRVDKSEIDFLEPEIDLSYDCKCAKREDPDKDFLMSVLPDIKKIHDDFKIDFKSELLQLIKNYRNVEHFKIE